MTQELFQPVAEKLVGIEGFIEFISTFDFERTYDQDTIIAMLSAFRKYRNNICPLSQEESTLLDSVQQQYELLKRQIHIDSNKLFDFDNSRTIGDDIVQEFRNDWEAAKSTRKTVYSKNNSMFKSWKDGFIVEEYIDNGIILKYLDSCHPLIYSTLGRALILGGHSKEGVPLLFKGLAYALNPNNPYWHSSYGIFGCVECLWEVIRLWRTQSNDGIWSKYETVFYKFLFLYLSRAIVLCEIQGDLKGVDFYRNRAFLLKDNGNIYMPIFCDYGFVANMDIQFISDNALGYELCGRLGAATVGADLRRFAFTMYDDYKEIEDAPFNEIVERGKFRSNTVAEKIIAEIEAGTLCIPSVTLAEIQAYLSKITDTTIKDVEFRE